MKFGESLDEGLVPEWKEQYVNYKAGKKKIKAIASLSDAVDVGVSDLTPLLDAQNGLANYGPAPDLGESALPEPRHASSRRLVTSSSTKNKREALVKEAAKFTAWLDKELATVDAFYTEKEKDVYHRFLILEDQFYQLKEHRTEYLRRQSSPKAHARGEHAAVVLSRWTSSVARFLEPLRRYEYPSLPTMAFMDKYRRRPLSDVALEPEYDVHYRENQVRNGRLAVTDSDDELSDLESSDGQPLRVRDTRQSSSNDRGDYVKRTFHVPYLYARKQLKTALVEHYRSITLLKSYRTMNRTAFRKITKKFDKATRMDISSKFMARVDDSYFQNSVMLDKITSRVEDMVLLFFDSERMDRKHGLEKLRGVTYAYANNEGRIHFHHAVFMGGLFLGVGLPFFGIALYDALHRTLLGVLPEGRYLLQVWAGFFLVNLAMVFVAITFLVYDRYRISYKFIFEFDLANALDAKQTLVLPGLGFALLALMAWLLFADFWPNALPGRTWPLIYLACMLIMFLWPGAQLYPHARSWLQVALWRIILSGLYPVEFRDFFLGDILCSLTYSISNLSFFICLYGVEWRHVLGGGETPVLTDQCGLSHSRLMGVLSALPSIWRFFQCLRRFLDSGDAFPHLANMCKYLVGALYYALLSAWRIHRLLQLRAAFITFATINSIFCLIWDIIMDWSLGQTRLSHYLLRDHLFYKRPSYYYTAVAADVVLRFQWIFYAFFSAQIQQLAVTSFGIALAELLRRFLWMFFRMENEHCANVILFRASRDSPLPYAVSSRVDRAVSKLVDLRYAGHMLDDEFGEASIKLDLKPTPHDLHRKSTFTHITNVVNNAHIKDFQRKKFLPRDDSDEE